MSVAAARADHSKHQAEYRGTDPLPAPDAPPPQTDENQGNPSESLKAVEQNITQSQQRNAALLRQQQQVATQLVELRNRSVKAARLEQDSEITLARLQKDLDDLAARSARSAKALNSRRAHQAAIAAALERVAMLPTAALVFSPETPVDTERSSMLLGGMVSVLRNQTQLLAADLDQLNALTRQMDEKRRQMLAKQAATRSQRSRLDAIITQRQALEAATAQAAGTEQRRLTALSAQATSLRDLIQRIEQEQQEREARAREAAAQLDANRGHEGRETRRVLAHPPPSDAPPIRLIRPAAGQIVKRFGEGDDFSTSKGITFQTSSGAQIVSPFSGKIMFAGAFKGYGQILIIDHGGGYHSLLAGLDRIHGAVGQSIVAGEPVGTMGTSGASSALYLELRWQGQPIDPTSSLEKRD